MLIDRERCEGHGFCEALAPDVFEVDDDGKSVARGELDAETAQLVLDSCPVAALRLAPE
ncbi:ferredoxin [Skermania piniformis]|uniref:Ferredoxin n=1 Tax=Skermania pinensis TaxID=39122 RepID=A0ABX8SDI7_9ACTN|nr:ferredoxin [Skermania piniformis]QXQ16000.1 ferredoxin [Skermania piniformis]